MNEQSMESLQKAIDGILHPWGWKLEAKKEEDEAIVIEYNTENLNKTLFSGAVFRLVLYEFEIRHFYSSQHPLVALPVALCQKWVLPSLSQ